MGDESWPPTELKEHCVAQAKVLRKQAAEGGMRFEAYLPPQLADWLLERIEQGVFLDPSEAVFVLLGEYQELEPHADLRRELLRRRLSATIEDPRPSTSVENVLDDMRKKFASPLPEPAAWKKSEKELDWSQCPEVECDPGKVSGAWVLKGTRMPISAILENIEAGASIDDITHLYDGVDRHQIQTVVRFANQNLRRR